MPASTPVDLFIDWLSARPRDARMAIAMDADPLDLSVPAFFKRLCPKINFPLLELCHHKDALLTRLEAVPEAADKIVERWGRPDDWGRGQVTAMVILARHRQLSVRDLWPDETEPVDFLAHALRLLIGYP